jgi:hypothetical protein
MVSFLTLEAVFIAAAILLAVMALLRARKIARRLDQVVESYWELRYENGQLRAQIDKLQGKSENARQAQGEAGAGATAFVPLSRLRSSDISK